MAIDYPVDGAVPIKIILGPFLDVADGVTPLTGLAGTMTVKQVKAGSSAATTTLDGSIMHRGDGYYEVPVDSSNFIFPELYTFYVTNPSVHLPVWKDVQMCGDRWSEVKWGAISNNLATSVTAGSIDAIRDAVKAMIVESQGSYTLQQALSIILAAVAGQTANNGATIKTPNGSATRIAATVNGGSKERTSMTLTPSS